MKLHGKDISAIVIGRTARGLFNYAFDYGIYPFALLKLGFLKGFLVMLAVTSLENMITLLVYFRMNIDWLGYAYIHRIECWADTEKGMKRRIGVLVRKSDLFVFVLLSTLRDSFETTAYFKPKYTLGKLHTALLFISSLILGNLYWSLGVEICINSWLREIMP